MQQFPTGAAPPGGSSGIGTYNTGITQAPSITPQQYQAGLANYTQIGQGAVGRPVGAAYGNYGHPQATPGGLFNQSRSLLGTDAGNQAANAYSNTVNQNEAQLAANQAAANSQAGLGYQSSLGNLYSGALGRGSTYNSATTQNQVRTQGLLNDLAGNLFGTQMGLEGQAIDPLLSGLFSGIGNIGNNLGDLIQGATSPASAPGQASLNSLLGGLSGA